MYRGTEAVTQVLLSAVTPQPWRNGAGVTHELLAWQSAQNWRCRISVANIDQDAPFSAFPGVQRWFAVIDGTGVALRFGDKPEYLMTPADAPLCFDGAAAPNCRLLGGASRDLNLMLRGANGGMRRSDNGSGWHTSASGAGIFAVCSGRLHLNDGRSFAVAPMSLVWFSLLRPMTMRFDLNNSTLTPGVPIGWWLNCDG